MRPNSRGKVRFVSYGRVAATEAWSFRKLLLRRGLSAYMLVGLLAFAVSCSGGRNVEGPQTWSDSKSDVDSVKILIIPSQMRANESFLVTYQAVPQRDLLLSAGLSLEENGRPLYTLVVRDILDPSSRVPAVVPPDGPIPKIALPGLGPFRFEMPSLEPGAYGVCSEVIEVIAGGDQGSGQQHRVCTMIDILA